MPTTDGTTKRPLIQAWVISDDMRIWIDFEGEALKELRLPGLAEAIAALTNRVEVVLIGGTYRLQAKRGGFRPSEGDLRSILQGLAAQQKWRLHIRRAS